MSERQRANQGAAALAADERSEEKASERQRANQGPAAHAADERSEEKA
ncbi:hypothetical protein [Catellatospora vulcania]|nr:hypothetical protein [Catellatospora vulcania]